MMHHINTVDHPGHHTHRTMAANLETTDPGRTLTPPDSGEYDNLLYGSQTDMEVLSGMGADCSPPPPLPPRTPACHSSPAPVPQTENAHTTHAQCYTQGQRIYPGHTQLHPPGALQASGTQGFYGNGYFQEQRHHQDSKTKTAMQVYLETKPKDFTATQVDACSANVNIKNDHVNQTDGKNILDQNRSDAAPGHVSSNTADHIVKSTAHHPPVLTTPGGPHQVIYLRQTNQPVASPTPGVPQRVLTFPNCHGQVGATAASSNPHTDTMETNMQASVQTRDYDPSNYRGGEEIPWSPAPPDDPRPVQSRIRRASGCRGIPGDQIMHNPKHTGEVATEQAVPRSQGTQCDSISYHDQNELFHLSPEQQPMDAEPKYDFQRNAGVGSPARREYGYRWETDGRQEMRSPENVGDMATEQARYRSQNPQCHILSPGDQREQLRVSLEQQTAPIEHMYDFGRDGEAEAPVERANGYREEFNGGQGMHQPEHARDVVSDQGHHKSQSAQCHMTPSTDQKEELHLLPDQNPVHTEPLYELIREDNITSTEETGKPSTDRSNKIASAMPGPSSPADKNNATKAPGTWICHCGNVNLFGKDCLACQEKKVKGLRESEKSNNSCIQESEDPVASSEVWQCKHCTYLNPMTERICEACAKTKDFLLEDTAQENQEENHVEEDSEDGLDNTEKKCPECDFVNLAEAELCISCACELPKDKKLGNPAGGMEDVSQHDRRCQFCTYENTVDARICEMCSRTLDEVSGSKVGGRTEEATYKKCKNCGKLIKKAGDICHYCRCGSNVPDIIPEEGGQERNEIGQGEKKTGVFQKVKTFLGIDKTNKKENPTIFQDKDRLPCRYCTYRNPPTVNICDICENPLRETAPEDASVNPPREISISEGVTISGEDFAKLLKAGKEHGFQQEQVIWALRKCGAEDPIRYLRSWDATARTEYETQAAQAAANQAKAYNYQHHAPAGWFCYPFGGPIFFYPQYDPDITQKETAL